LAKARGLGDSMSPNGELKRGVIKKIKFYQKILFFLEVNFILNLIQSQGFRGQHVPY
jgi:hypothetical protein